MEIQTFNPDTSTLLLRLDATRLQRRRLEADERDLFNQLPEGAWAEGEDEDLSLGRALGQSPSEIAERVGKHPAQVVKRTMTLRAAGKLSNPFNHGSRWTPETKAQLVDLHEGGASVCQCASFLGRTDASVRAQLAQLGRAVPPCW